MTKKEVEIERGFKPTVTVSNMSGIYDILPEFNPSDDISNLLVNISDPLTVTKVQQITQASQESNNAKRFVKKTVRETSWPKQRKLESEDPSQNKLNRIRGYWDTNFNYTPGFPVPTIPPRLDTRMVYTPEHLYEPGHQKLADDNRSINPSNRANSREFPIMETLKGLWLLRDMLIAKGPRQEKHDRRPEQGGVSGMDLSDRNSDGLGFHLNTTFQTDYGNLGKDYIPLREKRIADETADLVWSHPITKRRPRRIRQHPITTPTDVLTTEKHQITDESLWSKLTEASLLENKHLNERSETHHTDRQERPDYEVINE